LAAAHLGRKNFIFISKDRKELCFDFIYIGVFFSAICLPPDHQREKNRKKAENGKSVKDLLSKNR